MTEHRTLTRRLVREGGYVAEVEVTLIDSESDHPWAPYLSLDDAVKLDEARLALRRGDLAAAARLGRVYELVPVVVE
jgi:FAD synthase